MEHLRWVVFGLSACILCFWAGEEVFSQGVAVPHPARRAAPSAKVDVPAPQDVSVFDFRYTV